MTHIKNFKLPAIFSFFNEPNKIVNAEKNLTEENKITRDRKTQKDDRLENHFSVIILILLLTLLIIMPDND